MGLPGIFYICGRFGTKNGIPEVREVSRNVPEARGFVLAKYQPVASHGDPVLDEFYAFLGEIGRTRHQQVTFSRFSVEPVTKKIHFLDFW